LDFVSFEKTRLSLFCDKLSILIAVNFSSIASNKSNAYSMFLRGFMNEFNRKRQMKR